MGRQKSTKKSLIASLTALTLSGAMLAGTTLAWFTDSVTATANLITTGDLEISAEYFEAFLPSEKGDEDEPYTIDFTRGKEIYFSKIGHELTNATENIFGKEVWEPGKVGARLITVKSSGDFAAKVNLQLGAATYLNEKLEETVDEAWVAEFENALWFDVLKVGEDNDAASTAVVKRPLSEFNAYAETVTQEIPKGNTASFILIYGMHETATSACENKTFSADLKILATQAQGDEDIFGTDYDKDAAIHSVASGDEFIAALANSNNGDTILVTESIDLYSITTNIDGGFERIDKNLIIEGEEGKEIVIKNSCFLLEPDKNLTVKNLIFDNKELSKTGDMTTFWTEGVTGTVWFDNCTFLNNSRAALRFNGHDGSTNPPGLTANITVTNCTFAVDDDFESTLNGTKNTQRRYIQFVGTDEAKEEPTIIIKNNTFKSMNKVDRFAIQFECVDLTNVTVGNNTFSNTKGAILTTNQIAEKLSGWQYTTDLKGKDEAGNPDESTSLLAFRLNFAERLIAETSSNLQNPSDFE